MSRVRRSSKSLHAGAHKNSRRIRSCYRIVIIQVVVFLSLDSLLSRAGACRCGRGPRLAHTCVHAHLLHDLRENLSPFLLRRHVAFERKDVIQARPDATRILVLWVVEHLRRKDERCLVLLVRPAVPAPQSKGRVRVELHCELDNHHGTHNQY